MKLITRQGFLIFCLGILPQILYAQSSDSLQNKLSSTTNTTERIPILKLLGERKLNERDTIAFRYFEELITLSDQSDDPLLKAYAYYKMGVCRYQQNNIEESTSLYFQGLESTKPMSEFDETKAKLYNAIGWNFNLLGKPGSALKYLQEAEAYASMDNAQLMGLILNNKGVVYKNLEKFDSAFLSFQSSLQINRRISDQRQVRFNLNNIGNVLIALKQFGEADSYLVEALAMNEQANDTVEIVNNLMNLSIISVQQGSLQEAKAQLIRALSMAMGNNGLDQQRRIYYSLTSLSEQQGEYKAALAFQKEYYKLTDSLYRKAGIEGTLEVEAKYNNLIKEKELQEVRENVVEQRLYLSMIIGVLITTCVIIFFLGKMIRTRKMNERELMKLNKEIQKQSEELRSANKAITEANEALEEMVKYRSEIIETQSKRISHFSFVNSHEIRGPLATLMGLLGLLYDEKSPEKVQQILGFLRITSVKLDKIIQKVSQELEKEGDQV